MSGVVGRHSDVSPHTRKIVKREFPRLQLAKSSLDTQVEISRYLANRSRLQDICRTRESSVRSVQGWLDTRNIANFID